MQNTRGGRRLLAVIVGAALGLVVVAAASLIAGDRPDDTQQERAPMSTGLGEAIDRDVAKIRTATASFHSLDEAVKKGYAREVPHCVANPPEGGMGYHHQNEALLDARLELERPEILVYERLADGGYRLNGVEYIIPFSIWPMNRTPPRILGQDLKPAPQLKIWYLHVWVWLENPSGLFADWNPRVRC